MYLGHAMVSEVLTTSWAFTKGGGDVSWIIVGTL
jgi:hypothetical protein